MEREMRHKLKTAFKNFIEKVCKVTPSDDYICTFYYSLIPISSQNFEFDENIISTIEPTTATKDIIRVPIHKYSHSLFDSFTELQLCASLCAKSTGSCTDETGTVFALKGHINVRRQKLWWMLKAIFLVQ